MEQGEAIKKATFIVAKATVDRHKKDVVMVDMFDRNSNRLHFHKRADGEFVFNAFYLNDRIKGKTDAEIKNIFDVLGLLKQQGISIVYSAEHEDSKL